MTASVHPVPLSYSVASFAPHDFDNPQAKIRTLKDAGFRVLTLIPTYEVVTQPMPHALWAKPDQRDIQSLSLARTPSVESIREFAKLGLEAGMRVRLEPHIDADINFIPGSTHFWRARFCFDPTASHPGYLEKVILPIFEIARELTGLEPAASAPRVSLTLGSELETSLLMFPEAWLELFQHLDAIRQAESPRQRNIRFAHKVNWDYFQPSQQKRWIRAAAVKPSLSVERQWRSQTEKAQTYLKLLDTLSMSFYPPLAGRIPGCGTVPAESWHAPPDDRSVDAMAKILKLQWERWGSPMEQMGPSVEIAEAGVGHPDASMPWGTGHGESLATEGGRNLVRHYVRALCRFADECSSVFRDRASASAAECMPITFWTVAQFDWLGLRPEWSRWRIEDLCEFVRARNLRCSNGTP